MPTSVRSCPRVGCDQLISRGQRHCPEHAAEHEKARGTRQKRGYGPAHQAERARWAPVVATGTVECWRCGKLIKAKQPWDCGHDDEDRTKWRGPEHVKCNRSAGGSAAHPTP